MSKPEVIDPRFVPMGDLPTDISTHKSEYLEVAPTGGVLGSTIEFQVSASSAGLIDLSRSYILTRVHTQDGGGDMDVGDHGPEEGFSDCLWQSLDTYINGVSVGDSAPGLYPYAGWFRNALSKPASWANGQVLRYGFVDGAVNSGTACTAIGQVRPQHMIPPPGWGAENCGYAISSYNPGADLTSASPHGEAVTADLTGGRYNRSMAFRHLKVQNGTRGEFYTLPAHGIWRQPAYLPSNIDLRVVATKAPDAFAYHGATAGMVTTWATSTCTLMLRRVFPSESMQEAMAAAIIERPLKYNMVQSRVAVNRIANGSTGADITNVLAGVRPDTVIVAFVRSTARAGLLAQSPFCSIDYLPTGQEGEYVSSIYVNWGGRQFPMRPITATAKDDCGRAYAAYLAASSAAGAFGEETPMITPQDFRTGHKFFCFSLRPDERPAGEAATDLSDRGSLEVHATFSGALTADTSMISVGFSAAALEIDASRQISKIGY